MNIYISIIVYIVIFIIFTYEAGWIKWPFLKYTEEAFGRRSKIWLAAFGFYLIIIPILYIWG